jgi:hypothetical protein
MQKGYCLLLLLILVFYTVHGQTTSSSVPGSPVLSSPTPAGLGRYGVSQTGISSPVSLPGYYSQESRPRQNEQILQEVEQHLKQQQLQNQDQQLLAEAYQYLAHQEQKEQQQKEGEKRWTNSYQQARQFLTQMLQGQHTLDLAQAVFVVENAHHGNYLSYAEFNEQISMMVEMCLQHIPAAYRKKLTQTMLQAALFRFISDTTTYYNAQGKATFVHYPFRYDFDDYEGKQDYRKMFVTKLLQTNSGQCHSLPLLYLILAQRLGAKAYLSYAPNHSFIQHQDQQGNWKLLELTRGAYVSEKAMMQSGYIKAPAMKSKIYLDTVNLQQTVAQCVVDLALGFQSVFGHFYQDEFTMQCTERALQYAPNHIQALLIQAGIYEGRMLKMAKAAGITSLAQLETHPATKALYQQKQQMDEKIDSLGYIPMPPVQYEQWLHSIEKEKHSR